mgnify:CR=1 FL=1
MRRLERVTVRCVVEVAAGASSESAAASLSGLAADERGRKEDARPAPSEKDALDIVVAERAHDLLSRVEPERRARSLDRSLVRPDPLRLERAHKLLGRRAHALARLVGVLGARRRAGPSADARRGDDLDQPGEDGPPRLEPGLAKPQRDKVRPRERLDGLARERALQGRRGRARLRARRRRDDLEERRVDERLGEQERLEERPGRRLGARRGREGLLVRVVGPGRRGPVGREGRRDGEERLGQAVDGREGRLGDERVRARLGREGRRLEGAAERARERAERGEEGLLDEGREVRVRRRGDGPLEAGRGRGEVGGERRARKGGAVGEGGGEGGREGREDGLRVRSASVPRQAQSLKRAGVWTYRRVPVGGELLDPNERDGLRGEPRRERYEFRTCRVRVSSMQSRRTRRKDTRTHQHAVVERCTTLTTPARPPSLRGRARSRRRPRASPCGASTPGALRVRPRRA